MPGGVEGGLIIPLSDLLEYNCPRACSRKLCWKMTSEYLTKPAIEFRVE